MNRSERTTFSALHTAREKAQHLPFDPGYDRFVIFSDIHKADGIPGIDDFRRNEMVFAHALQYYLDRDWGLVLNGDIEECWESKPRSVVNAYRDTIFALEGEFARKGERYYVRIFGNHDDLWSNPAKVQKHLWPALNAEINVYPALMLGDDIIVLHGHQGDGAGDTYSWLSRYFIRHGWRWLQRFTRISTSRASRNHFLRRKRDQLLYRWAKQEQLLLVAGHTHRAMFRSYSNRDELQTAMNRLLQTFPDEKAPYWVQANLDKMREMLNDGGVGIRRKTALSRDDDPVPCYFNGGAAVHRDAITGIELDAGEIRLIKWSLSDALELSANPLQEGGAFFPVERRILQRANLEDVIGAIKRKPRLGTITDPKPVSQTADGIAGAAA